MAGPAKKQDKALDRQRTVEIYAKAAQIFHRKGFDATSMSDIAEAVQLTKAGLYYYIHSKEQLLFEILSYAMEQLEVKVIQPASEVVDAEERLRDIIRRHGSMLTEGNKWISILTDEVDCLSLKHRREIVERKRAYLDLVRGTVEALRSEGKLRDVDASVAAFSLFGMLLWLPRWFKQGGRMSSSEVVDGVMDMALFGMFQKGARE